MSLLTQAEIEGCQRAGNLDSICRAIESAVIARLATVSVEPVVFCDDYYTFFCFSADIASKNGASIQLYSKEAIAAARVQAIEEAAKVAEGQATIEGIAQTCAYEIRALIGGKE